MGRDHPSVDGVAPPHPAGPGAPPPLGVPGPESSRPLGCAAAKVGLRLHACIPPQLIKLLCDFLFPACAPSMTSCPGRSDPIGGATQPTCIGGATQPAVHQARSGASQPAIRCVSTMTCYEAFAVQPALTKTYVTDVLDLLMDEAAVFTLSAHEFLPPSEMDRASLTEMAKYMKERLSGNTEPLKMDFYFDELVLQTLAPEDSFNQTTQGARLEHYHGVCRRVLQKHKWPLSCIAAAAASAAQLTQTETDQFRLMVAAHDFSKLALPHFFCAGASDMVPGATKPLMQFAKKDSPFFKLMFSFVQMHRLLEIPHHQSVLKKTTGRLHEIAAAYLEACSSENGRLTYLEIACDTLEASLSRRCPTSDNNTQGAADASGVNPWVDFASKNFMENKAQEIPEPTLGGVMSLLFPVVANDRVSSNAIMEEVGTWTTAQVRVQSPVFHAMYTAYDEAVLLKRER